MAAKLKNTKTAVVIEIGNDWIKIIEGKVSDGGIVITKSSFRKLAHIKESVTESVVKLWAELKLGKRNVIPYIPRHLITVRILDLPSTNPAEIEEMINLQIGKQTPYSKDEIVFNYQIIDSIREGYTKVMLAIAKRNIINERLEIIQKAGGEAVKFPISSEGVYHWFKALHDPSLNTSSTSGVILVDVDSNYSDFLFYYKGKLAFSKNILIGSNHLADPQGVYQQKLADEVYHSKEVCMEEWKGITPAKIFFTGSIKEIERLLPALKMRLEAPCEIIDPSKDVQMNVDDSISISAMLGFLIKQQDAAFNLIPQEKNIQRAMEGKRKDLTILGGLFGAVVMMLSLLVFIHIEQKSSYLTQIKSKLADIKINSLGVDKMRSSITLARERLDARGDCLNLLDDIYKNLPPNIYLVGVSIERKGRISLKGQAVAMSEVFRFINKLEGISNLKNVQNTYATTNKQDNSEFNTDFEITAFYNDKGS